MIRRWERNKCDLLIEEIGLYRENGSLPLPLSIIGTYFFCRLHIQMFKQLQITNAVIDDQLSFFSCQVSYVAKREGERDISK